MNNPPLHYIPKKTCQRRLRKNEKNWNNWNICSIAHSGGDDRCMHAGPGTRLRQCRDYLQVIRWIRHANIRNTGTGGNKGQRNNDHYCS